MNKVDELTKEIKTLEEHIEMYPLSSANPVRVARIKYLKQQRARLIGKK